MKQINPGINNTAPYKKFDSVWSTPQTKKNYFNTGGGSLTPFKGRSGKSKKWKINPMRYAVKNPLKKSTKSGINPKRYLAPILTKEKRESRAHRRDESIVHVKANDYKRVEESIEAYKKAEATLKKKEGVKQLDPQGYANAKKTLADAESHMTTVSNGYVTKDNYSSKLKQVKKKVEKYEEKQKYYEESTVKLKHDSIEFIKNRTEYIKNGRPDLVKKLDSLSTHDHTKMAFIKIPGIGPKPVNKLKYSDFNIENPRVTNAYLGQFKTVNESMVKINKDFDINALSAEHKVELAKELHKITKEGILDPAAQEQHYLKAVTDIAYKNEYYSLLRNDVAKSYIESSGSLKIHEDPPELNLRQQKTALEQRLRRTDSLSDAEKNNIRTEIGYLDKQLSQTPEGIDRQIRAQEALMQKMSPLDPKYDEMSLALDRLKEHRQNIDTVQQADFAEDTKLISSELAKLKEERDVFLASTKIDTSVDVNELKKGLNEITKKLYDRTLSNESNTNTPDMTVKRQKRLEAKGVRLAAEIEKQEKFKQMQDAISELANMTPEKREKFKDELQGKSENELETLHSLYSAKSSAFKTNPALKDIIQRDLVQIQSALVVEQIKKEIDKDTNLVGLQKEHMKRQITGDMTNNNINLLRKGIIEDNELNFRFAKQSADKHAANADAERTASKQAVIDARQKRKEELKTIWQRTQAAVTRTPENIKVLERAAKSNKSYSKAVARQTKRISNAVAQGKITPEKAKQLLREFEERHAGYVPDNSKKLLRRVADPTAKPLQQNNLGHFKNPLYEPGYASRPAGFNNPQYGQVEQPKVPGFNNPAYNTMKPYGTVEYASIPDKKPNTPNKSHPQNTIYNSINTGDEYLEILPQSN